MNIHKSQFSRLQLDSGGALRDLASTPPDRFLLKQLQLGPWVLHELEARVCESCETSIGETILTELSSYEQFESGMKFLVLQSQ